MVRPLKLTLPQLFLAVAKEVPGPDGKMIAEPEQELVGHRQVAAEREDRSARPAPDLRYPRRAASNCCSRRAPKALRPSLL